MLCCRVPLLFFGVSTVIMGDDSKIVPKASASRMKKDHPSCDYSTPVTCDKLDGSNYVAWSRGARLTITTRRMARFINGKKTALLATSDAYTEWEEDNCLVQSWILNSMTSCALFDQCATTFDVWEAAQKTYTVIQNGSNVVSTSTVVHPYLSKWNL